MDVEDYLRKKRELEHKKEILEAKEKLDEIKTPPGIRQQKPIAATKTQDPVQIQHAGKSGWRTIGNVVLILLIIGLTYKAFFMGKSEDQTSLQQQTANAVTGNVVQQQNTQTQTTTETVQEINESEGDQSQENTAEEEPQEETLPGPTFSLQVKDKTLGIFDATGKISGQVLVIQATPYYHDGQLFIENKEASRIKCFVDRTIDIDNDFDGKYESQDISLDRFKVEIDADQVEKLDDTMPSSTVEKGSYEGKGNLMVEYEGRCFFCLDEKCDTWEEKGKEKHHTNFKISMNPETSNTDNSNESES